MKAPKRIRISSIVLGLIFLAGLSLLLYPLVSNQWNEWRSSALIGDYEEQVQELSQNDTQSWFKRARAYNATLVGRGIPDAFAIHSAEENSEYASQLAFRGDGMMGTISIPRIRVNLPIYHGTGKEVLTKGAGHLQGSALPVGGSGTHCVISAHRGLPSASMFTDLDQLEVGDHFYLTVLGKKIAYKVDKILEVEPDQTKSLAIKAGKDLCTLVTCTPYGVNTRRLLVRGHRVAYSAKTEAAEGAAAKSSIFTQYGLWVLAGLAVVVVFSTVVWFRAQQKKGARSGEGASAGSGGAGASCTIAGGCSVASEGARPDGGEGEPGRTSAPLRTERGDLGEDAPAAGSTAAAPSGAPAATSAADQRPAGSRIEGGERHGDR